MVRTKNVFQSKKQIRLHLRTRFRFFCANTAEVKASPCSVCCTDLLCVCSSAPPSVNHTQTCSFYYIHDEDSRVITQHLETRPHTSLCCQMIGATHYCRKIENACRWQSLKMQTPPILLVGGK